MVSTPRGPWEIHRPPVFPAEIPQQTRCLFSIDDGYLGHGRHLFSLLSGTAAERATLPARETFSPSSNPRAGSFGDQPCPAGSGGSRQPRPLSHGILVEQDVSPPVGSVWNFSVRRRRVAAAPVAEKDAGQAVRDLPGNSKRFIILPSPWGIRF